MTAARRLGQPCPHHAVDFISASLRVLAVHPLPVQPDTELVHVQGGLYARGLWCPFPWCAAGERDNLLLHGDRGPLGPLACGLMFRASHWTLLGASERLSVGI